MSYLPCTVGSHRFVGPIQHFYPALLNGTYQQRRHLRLCPKHANEVLVELAPLLVPNDDVLAEEDPAPRVCLGCERECRDGGILFFCTAYPKSSDRTDYFGVLHPDCRPPEWVETLFK